MEIRNLIATFATSKVWPGCSVQWTAGYSRHCPPDAPDIDGIRLLFNDGKGRLVDAVDAETLPALLAKVVERYRVKRMRDQQLRRFARSPRTTF